MSRDAASAFEALRRGFDGVQGPPPGTFTIVDYLGPATPEQVSEVKTARRTEQRKALKDWAAFWGWMTLGLTLIGVGSVLGNRLGVDVTDLVSLLGGAR